MPELYKKVPTDMKFVERELEVLEYWKRNGIFQKSIALREGAPEFTFYDGPPTANGMPHIGHVLTRAIKDLIPRYRTMKGYNVLRKAGWDTHGLPVELEVEKQLGLDGKPQIEKYGIEPFIRKCKESVWKYKGEWERISERVGFWLDMDDPYVTYENNYIESVWWSLKQIFDKGLLYKGYKVVPYCPRCGTALSSHEVAQGYEDVEEPSATARFKVSGRPGAYILAWTTTPWTLPSNIALCVSATAEYGEYKTKEGETLIMAAALAANVLPEGAELVRKFKGEALVDTEYEQLFRAGAVPEGQKNRVVSDAYVTMEEGTGIVHLAPYGEDDMRILKREGLSFNIIVDAQGRFGEGTPWPGVFVKDADAEILRDLKERGQLQASPMYLHSYPFCWRCDTPLLYYPRENWFIRMTAIREKLIECNRSVNWIPENIKEGRMGNFVENVIDWGVSRERYWGTPLPVWVCACGHVEAVGSREQLMKMGTGVPPDLELHKPFIDAVELVCPKCGGAMKREPYVIDCWYDSGSMPFAQWHYPFENKEKFQARFPADFISEAIDQTRGWFYTLLAISTLLFGKSSFENCLVLGHVGDKDGVKMSKHKGNVVDPWDMLDTRGADAVRWYFYTGSAPWLPSRFSGDAVSEAQRKYMGTLWNTYAFYVLYANIDGFDPTQYKLDYSSLGVMDRWILSRLQSLVKEVDEGLERYRVTEPGRALADFVDELSNWYVRRGRERYWGGGMPRDKINAFLTLHTALVTLSKLTAPFTPFIAEQIYLNLARGLNGDAPESVHLTDFPVANEAWSDRELEANIARVLDIVALGRACRNMGSVKNRQPVPALFVEGAKLPQGFVDLVADELNVKRVEFVESAEGFVQYTVKPQLKTLGPRWGKLLPQIREALLAADGTALVLKMRKEGSVTLTVAGAEVTLGPDDILTEVSQKSDFVTASEGGVSVALDARLTPELIEEGFVREIISKVQMQRREAGFEVTDHIALMLDGAPAALATALKNKAAVAADVLADEVAAGRGEGFGKEQDINGEEMFFTVRKI
jgi:isoleucyl-tRNA synthetase